MPDGSEFEWDEGNEGHIAPHVEPREAEDALRDPRGVPRATYNVPGEQRYAFLGATRAGRLLVVVFTHRHRKIRVVTAREATNPEKRRYRKR